MEIVKKLLIILVMLGIVGGTVWYIYNQVDKFNKEYDDRLSGRYDINSDGNKQNNSTTTTTAVKQEDSKKLEFDISDYVVDSKEEYLSEINEECTFYEEPVKGQNVAYCKDAQYIVNLNDNNKIIKKFINSIVWMGGNNDSSDLQYYVFKPNNNVTGDKLVILGPNFDFIDYVGYFNDNHEQSAFVVASNGNAVVTNGINFKIYDKTGKLLYTSKNYDRVTPVSKIDNCIAVINNNKLSLVDYNDNLIVEFDTSIAENVNLGFYNYKNPAIYFEADLNNESRISIGVINITQELNNENFDIYVAHYYPETKETDFRKCASDIEYISTR